MPASTFEIIAEKWEGSNELFCKIANTSWLANLYLSVFKGNIEIRLTPNSEKSLNFEIRTQDTLDMYLEKYPSAKYEPEERIPYFVFDASLDSKKYYSIAIANNYLDSELIWEFAKKYLEDYPKHIICLNREVFIDAAMMADIVATTEYREGWCFKLKDLPR